MVLRPSSGVYESCWFKDNPIVSPLLCLCVTWLYLLLIALEVSEFFELF